MARPARSHVRAGRATMSAGRIGTSGRPQLLGARHDQGRAWPFAWVRSARALRMATVSARIAWTDPDGSTWTLQHMPWRTWQKSATIRNQRATSSSGCKNRKCPGERAEGRVVVAHVPSECPGLPDETSPPQVSTIEGVSRPVGRVLCARSRGPAVIHLGLPLPAASCGLPASIGRAALDRSRRERRSPLDLAPGGVYRAATVTCGAGGLLHHRFTLAPAAAEAVCFLWHCPAGRPGSALPTTLPCGARTFLTGLAPGATARPTHPQLRIRAPPGQPTEPVPPRIGHPLVLRDFFLPNGR